MVKYYGYGRKRAGKISSDSESSKFKNRLQDSTCKEHQINTKPTLSFLTKVESPLSLSILNVLGIGPWKKESSRVWGVNNVMIMVMVMDHWGSNYGYWMNPRNSHILKCQDNWQTKERSGGWLTLRSGSTVCCQEVATWGLLESWPLDHRCWRHMSEMHWWDGGVFYCYLKLLD